MSLFAQKDECNFTSESTKNINVGWQRLFRALFLVSIFLGISLIISLVVGYRTLDFTLLRQDELARILFFELRLPRVLLAGILGASLGSVGACLQAFFRNPLAEPFTLGVSGGGTLGASLAIALGWGINLGGIPIVFVAAFAAAAGALSLIHN